MAFRIAIDGRTLTDHYPGIGRYTWNLVRALARVAEDAEILLLEPSAGENTRFPLHELEAAGVRRVAVRSSVRGLVQQVALPRQLRELGAEVFHAPYYLTAYRPPCPLVVTVYDAIGARWPESLPSGLARRAYRVAVRQALGSARAVLALSRAAKEDLVGLFRVAAERVTVTPAAADPGLAPAPPAARGEVRGRLGLPERYVLHLGTSKPHKNLARLVEAWAEVPAESKIAEKGKAPCRLVLAGRHDPRFPEARERARELGLEDVRFLGEVAEGDLGALYSGADFFVLPSLAEGFGLPVLEAMACGVAVACSKTSALPAVAGAAAAYFDPDDVGSIAGTLARLLKNSGYRRTLAERGEKQAGQFSWERTALQTLRVYRQLV